MLWILRVLCVVVLFTEGTSGILTQKIKYGEEKTLFINSTTREYVLEFYGEKENKPHQVTVNRINTNSSYPLMVVARTPMDQLSWELPLEFKTNNGTLILYRSSRILCRVPNDTATPYDGNNPILNIFTESPQTIEFTVLVNYVENFTIDSFSPNFTVSPSEPKYFYYNFSKKPTKELDYDTVILNITSSDDQWMTVSIQSPYCPVFDLEPDVRYVNFFETISMHGGLIVPKSKFKNGFFVVFVVNTDNSAESFLLGSSPGNRTKYVEFTIYPGISYKDYKDAVFVTFGAIALFYCAFLLSFILCWKMCHRPPKMGYVDVPLDEEENEADNANAESQENILLRRILYLSDLLQRYPEVHRQNSYNFLYKILIVGLFYGIPAIQLVVIYQRILNTSGDVDLCYFNFFCANPAASLSDFNHVFSNVGYVCLGLLFLMIVYKLEKTHTDSDFDQSYGIPQHFGLYHAMGVALIMEGILSASYHVCPTGSNFQFDTSFMYVMAVLCMVKLYENRHPYIDADAFYTFGILAIAVFFSIMGILAQDNLQIFLGCFSIIHILSCLYLTVEIYYAGCWECDRGLFTRIYQQIRNDYRLGFFNIFKPAYKHRFIFLLLANICNLMLIVLYFENILGAFPMVLLTIFLCNTSIYFIYYIIMKYLHQERVNLKCWIFLILALLSGVPALYFFKHTSVSWDVTPAKSHDFNRKCEVLHFYDSHDIWHFLSAISMFFLYMGLLTLDDDLSHTDRRRIRVF